MAVAVTAVIFAVQAIAASPEVTAITEPALGSAPLNPADVHMVAGFAGEEDHACSDWEIRTVLPDEAVWQANCAKGQEKVHIHLGDGTFVNSHAGRLDLKHDTAYVLRVRSSDEEGEEVSEWATRPFVTRPPGPPGDDATTWTVRDEYAVEVFAEGLQLPVDIAMVPEPGPHPGDPLMYVTELYGAVKAIARDGTVHDYETELLNFNPTGNFPGSGEIGVAGAVVEPDSGDLFVSLVYEDKSFPTEPKPHYPRVIRLHSDESGLEAIGQTPVLDMAGETQDGSHQVSNLTITPGGELLVHNGDGIAQPQLAQDLDRYRGKILRMTLEGDPVEENFEYDTGDGITARDYVYAYGLRNPFGGAWRLSDGTHFMVENGPAVDRLAKVVSGENYRWPEDLTMSHLASYLWEPSHAPVSIEFVEPARFGGSGFPPQTMGHAFVTESGPTWAGGPQESGKRIVEFGLDEAGKMTSGPETLVEYAGTGKATAVGLAAGQDGLYFTDLYKDKGFESPIDRGANVLRVRHCADDCPLRSSVPPSPGSSGEGPPGDPPAGGDLTAPVVRRFGPRPQSFAVPVPGGRSARRSPASFGSTFLYSLSERAAVRILIAGLPLTNPRRLWGQIGAPGVPGINLRWFSGRLNGRPLPPGHYLATIVARDAAGNLSARREARFRVVPAQ